MKKTIILALLLTMCSLAYGADYAKRWPTDTALEVVTPTSGDSRYLKLDCSNDPLTASLDIYGNVSAYDAAHTSYIRIAHDGTSANVLSNGGDISLLAPGTSNIGLRLGDALGANKVSIMDSGNNEMASINSDGDFSTIGEYYAYNGANWGSFSHDGADAMLVSGMGDITLMTASDVNALLSDAAGASYFRVQDSGVNTVASIDSDGNIDTIGDIFLDDNKETVWGSANNSYAFFDGNSLNIVANAVTATDDMEFTAESFTFNGNIAGTLGLGDSTHPCDLYIHDGGGIWLYEDGDNFLCGAVCKDGAAEWQFQDDVNIGSAADAENLYVHNGGTITAYSAGDDKSIQISHNDTNGLITSSDGTISFDNDNLKTTGSACFGTATAYYPIEVKGHANGQFARFYNNDNTAYYLIGSTDAAYNTSWYQDQYFHTRGGDYTIYFLPNERQVASFNDSAVVFNGSSNDVDFRIESNGNDNMFFVDGGNDRVGIGTASPATTLDIDSNSNTQCLRLRGADAANEIADVFVNASGSLVITTDPGSDTYGIIDLGPAGSTDYGIVIRAHNSPGAGIYSNITLNDAATDYLNITTGASNATLGVTIDANQNVGIGKVRANGALDVEGSVYAKETVSAKLAIKRTLSVPVTNPTITDDYLIYRFPEAVTIRAINGVCLDGTSITCKINECDGDGDNAAQICDAVTITTSNTAANLTNTSVDAGDYISYTSSAMVGTVTKFVVVIDYTVD